MYFKIVQCLLDRVSYSNIFGAFSNSEHGLSIQGLVMKKTNKALGKTLQTVLF